MSQGKLCGKVAIVTGAGRGIGAAVARRLAAEGASVVVNDLGAALDGSGSDASPAEEVVELILKEGGVAVTDTANVANFDAVAGLVRGAIDQFGELDVVVNVAGILRDRMIFNMSEAEWDAVLAVHLKGTFNTTRHASAHWKANANADRPRRLINFTSDSGLFGAPTQPNYAAAKMGIFGLTQSCANSLGRFGVTTNAIAPVADTRMNEDVPAAQRRRASGQNRDPEDVATVVAYLASDSASWCNGRVIGVSGRQVSLYSDPQVIRQVHSAEPWDLDELGAYMRQSFEPVRRNSDGRYKKMPSTPS